MKRDNEYLKGNQFAKGNKPNKTAFKKGSIPWNKGKGGIHLSRETEFKKGRPSLNQLEVGTIKIRKTKGRLRKFIKVSDPGTWEEHARYIWKQTYEHIIKGDIIHHMNGNVMDDRIENLIALPRTEHPVFHSRWGLTALTEEQLAFYLDRYRQRAHPH